MPAPYRKEKPSINEKPLTERKKRALDYVKDNGSITNKIYQELTNISKPTATRDLAELVKLNIVEKTGTAGESVKYILVGS